MITTTNLVNGLQKQNRIIEMIGVPGVGKDRIMHELRTEHNGIKAISFSSIAALVSARTMKDNATTCNVNEIKEGVKFMLDNQPLIVSTHTIYRTRTGAYEFEIGSEYQIRPSAYIHVISDPDTIMQRINKDNKSGDRKREFGRQEITLMQDISIAVTQILSKELGVLYYNVLNNGDPRTSAKEVFRIAHRHIL